MIAEQLEELLGRMGTVTDGWRVLNGKYGPQIHSEKHWLANLKCESCPVRESDVATLIALAPSLARRVIAAERVAAALENMMSAYLEPDRRMCCNGQHCGCMGATVREEADWISSTALTAYREASK